MKSLSEEKKEKYRFRKKSKKETPIENKENIIKNEIIIKEDVIKEKNKKNKLKEDINEIERVCTDKTLKKDLIELYEKVVENNSEFKDKIFFKNLLNMERKIGKMDDLNQNKISHTFKEIETRKILKIIEDENSLMRKYTIRAKKINDVD